MAFDPNSARPVGSKFDPKTAKPVNKKPMRPLPTSPRAKKIAAARDAAPGWMKTWANVASPGLFAEIDAARAGVEQKIGNVIRDVQGKPILVQSRDVQQAVRERNDQGVQLFAKDHPKAALAINVFGGILTPQSAVGGKYVSGAKTLGQTALRSGGVGALTGAAYGAGEGETIGERSQNAFLGAGTGFALGTAIPFATKYATRAVPKKAPAVARKADVRKLQQEGVDLTYGEMMGGPVKKFEDMVSTMSGGVSKAQVRGREQLQAASINRALAPIGEKLTKGLSGREAVAEMVEKRSAAYDKAFQGVTFRPDRQFGQDIKQAADDALFGADDATRKAAQEFVSNFVGSPTKRGGSMAGQDLTAVMSRLSKAKATAYKNNNRALGEFMVDLEGAIIGAAERSKQGSAQMIRNAKRAYMLSIRPEKAAGFLGAEGGVPSASQFQSAVKAATGGPRKTAFTTGKAEMQDLSEAAVNVMSPTIRSTGSAERGLGLAWLATSGVGGFVNPAFWTPIAAEVAAQGLYSRPVLALVNKMARASTNQQRQSALEALKQLARNNPEARQALEQMLTRAGAMGATQGQSSERRAAQQ